jgi:hypothetical protein
MVVINDINGRIVYQREFQRNGPDMLININVSNLLSGTYFVKLNTDATTTKTIQFIKH